MHIHRMAYTKLLDWKEKSQGRTALLLEGACCVGKSSLAQEFAKNEYRSFLHINFSTSLAPDVFDIFEHATHDLETFFSRLELLFDTRLYSR